MTGAWLEVFKSGTHTSGNGVTKTYTDEDIQHIAKSYNDQKDHEAPFVIGHPATDGPAHGWTKELKAVGGKLMAYVDQVADGVVDAVKRGEYKKVSIALYPGGLLRHIGLLGAVPPAVKGLAPVQFAEDLEFEEYIWVTDETRMPTVARILSGLRDFLIDKFGLETADRIVDKDDVCYLQRPIESVQITLDDQKKIVPPENINLSPPGAITNFNELTEQEEKDMDELKAKIEAMEAVIAAQSVQFSEVQAVVKGLEGLLAARDKEDASKKQATEVETAKASFAEVVEGLVRDGKILPAEKDIVIEDYADALSVEEGLTFSEGSVKPSERMKTRLMARPQIFKPATGSFASRQKAAPIAEGAAVMPVEFSEMSGRVDPASLEVHRKICEFAEKNNITYEEAAARYAAA